ncbi:MAG: VapC toxin family PIN domain ribonuclease [Robiginitomaculum sp.]|nr:MAG: VapC toxin family PIN domain ribonuclease [Robiginitomaculum sp.]
MSGFVLDCSVAIAWCIEDEATPQTDALLERIRDFGAYVPQLWGYEFTNVMLQANKRERLTDTQLFTIFELFENLPITIIADTEFLSFKTILALSQAENLTSYDAAYLDLAMTKNLPLATLDKALRRACKNVGVDVLP